MRGHYLQQTKSGNECHFPRSPFLFCLHNILRGCLGGGAGPSYHFWPQVLTDMHRGWVPSLCQIKVSICSLPIASRAKTSVAKALQSVTSLALYCMAGLAGFHFQTGKSSSAVRAFFPHQQGIWGFHKLPRCLHTAPALLHVHVCVTTMSRIIWAPGAEKQVQHDGQFQKLFPANHLFQLTGLVLGLVFSAGH